MILVDRKKEWRN